MDGTMSVEFRGAIVEIVYEAKGGDDVIFWFADGALNDIPLSSRERQDIWREAMSHSGRG